MLKGKYRHFSDINPTFFKIAAKKEILRRHIKNAFGGVKFARETSDETLPVVVYSHSSDMIKRGPGVDPKTQENKAVNIGIASSKMHRTLIKPGETFSFWDRVGSISAKKGYLEGRILKSGVLTTGTGGGLCNLANTLNLLILHSPLDITEFHSHSDALAPDQGERRPMANGTSVFYNSVDYRFKNNTDQTFQLLIRCEGDTLLAELRSEKEIPFTYDLIEEDHHFTKEGEKYYRVSKIYKITKDRETGEEIKRELFLDNHSLVHFDYSLIPEELIR